MRAVIIGTDFIYDNNGNLKPIEINTNITLSSNRLEFDQNEIFDMTDFANFITENGFNKVTYLGSVKSIKDKINDVCDNLSIEFTNILVGTASLTIPYVEDSVDHLIVRTAYDTTAILDDLYCKNKVNYLNLIKDTDFGPQFAYSDEVGDVINHITQIKDNGVHPNFILKAKLPNYDKTQYPKLFRVTSQSELDSILENVTDEYFLMEFYLNLNKVYNDVITKIRKISMLFPPSLESIHLGSYTDLATQSLSVQPQYDPITFELLPEFRSSYITSNLKILQPKLMDDDYVILSDGTKKSGLDLQVGDILKTIDIPNSDNVNILDELVNYNIDIETFISGATFTSNAVTMKKRIDGVTKIFKITFTDGTTWSDTEYSSYLVNSENTVKFKLISDFIAGDILILIDTSIDTTVTVIQKTISSLEIVNEMFSGWIITVEREHIFLTQTVNETNPPSLVAVSESFAAVEHNNVSCFNSNCYTGSPSNGCGKGQCCCGGKCSFCIN
jgi:hypothetical protein